MMTRLIRISCATALAVVLAACGGGSGDGAPPVSGGPSPTPTPTPTPAPTPTPTPTPTPSPSPGIGAAGGTVSDASGAKVVIPAGALTTTTAIAVAQSSVGAPPLPAGVTPFGQIFAFTPHGTTFAVPVTITVPFDSASVPAGGTPTLYKTNAAMTDWDTVPGATVSGSAMSGSVTSFSNLFVGPLPPPKLEKGTPKRGWTVLDILRDHTYVDRDFGAQTGGIVEEPYDFGPALMLDPGVPLPAILPRELRATGRIFSSAGGGSYSVSNEAPVSHDPKEIAGNFIDFGQTQSYIKRVGGAKLSLIVTQARVEAYDNASPNPGPCARPGPRCNDQKFAQVSYKVLAYTKPSAAHPSPRTFYQGAGLLNLSGWRRHWKPNTQHSIPPTAAGPTQSIWTDQDVTTDLDVDAEDGRHARLSLKKTLTVPIDISSIAVNEEFTLDVEVDNQTFDGRPAPEFNYLGAFLRDPTKIDGDLQLAIEGLDPTDSPTDRPGDDPNLPAECRGKPVAGTLQLASPAYSVTEGAGPDGIDLLILRTGGRAGEVSAKVTTSDGTATAPGDYASVNTTVTFKDGDITPRFINVPLVYSTDAEGDKTFTVTLSDPTGCAILGQTTSTVTIIDDTRPVPAAQIFSLGGTVSGLVGGGLILQTNAFDQAQPAANGAFTFPVRLADATSYTVSVVTQPSNPIQSCSVTNGSGTIAGADVTNIAVNCVTPPPVGALDTGFGSQGKVTNSVTAPTALALQADGKVLALGGMTLSRYNANGSVDTSFGTSGKVTIVANGGGLDVMTSLAVQGDGKILVAGITSLQTVANDDDFVVLRFNADGSPDASFGTGGKTVTDFNGLIDQAKAVMIQADGKIVVAGQVQFPPLGRIDLDFAVVRYLPDGTLDTTFGTGGKTTLTVAGRSDLVNAAALQADGSIVLVGRVFTDGGTGNSDIAVARFFANGAVDTTFGTNGAERIDFNSGGVVPVTFDGGEPDEALDVLVQPDGKILIGGYTSVTNAFRSALVRLTSTGAIDTSFGLVTSAASDKARGIALQGDGKVVAVGAGNSDFALLRFTSTGAPDSSFGTNGVLAVDFFAAADVANDVLVQPDGKIVVAGSARNGISGGGLGMVRVAP